MKKLTDAQRERLYEQGRLNRTAAVRRMEDQERRARAAADKKAAAARSKIRSVR